MTTDWGVEYHWKGNAVFTAGGYTEKGARQMVEGRAPTDPVAAFVCRREVGPWQRADEGEA